MTNEDIKDYEKWLRQQPLTSTDAAITLLQQEKGTHMTNGMQPEDIIARLDRFDEGARIAIQSLKSSGFTIEEAQKSLTFAVAAFVADSKDSEATILGSSLMIRAFAKAIPVMQAHRKSA